MPHVIGVLAGQQGTSELTEYYRGYLAVGVFVAAAMLLVSLMLGVGFLIRPKRPQDEKYITYESGSDPFGVFGQQLRQNRIRFRIVLRTQQRCQ